MGGTAVNIDTPLAPYPRRELTFTGDGDLATALGLDQERSDAIEMRVNEMLDRNASKREIFTHFNTEWDCSDVEWTVLCFGIGFYEGRFGLR